jgi:transcription antitermination factor NusG
LSSGEAVLADTFRKHQTVRAEIDTCKLKVNEFARLIDGAFKGFQVRIQAMTPTKVRFMLNGIPMTAPIEHCEAI